MLDCKKTVSGRPTDVSETEVLCRPRRCPSCPGSTPARNCMLGTIPSEIGFQDRTLRPSVQETKQLQACSAAATVVTRSYCSPAHQSPQHNLFLSAANIKESFTFGHIWPCCNVKDAALTSMTKKLRRSFILIPTFVY